LRMDRGIGLDRCVTWWWQLQSYRWNSPISG
jgi:hypothetical protein